MSVYTITHTGTSPNIRSWDYDHHTYLGAVEGTESQQYLNLSNVYRYMGVDWNGTYYVAWEAFYEFDTSVIPDDETIVSVRFVEPGYLDWDYQDPFGNGGHPTDDSILEVRVTDWVDPFNLNAWVPGSQLASHALMASRRFGDAAPRTSYSGYNWLEEAPGAKDCINKEGITRVVIADSQMRLGVPPEAHESWSFYRSGPYMVIVTEPADTSRPQLVPDERLDPWDNDLRVPAHTQIGDLMVLLVADNGNLVLAPPIGWTAIEELVADNFGAAAYWKVATLEDCVSPDDVDYVVDFPVYGHMLVFRAGTFYPASPIGDSSSAFADETAIGPTAPSILQTDEFSTLVFLAAKNMDSYVVPFSNFRCADDNPTWTTVYSGRSFNYAPSVGIAIAPREEETATGVVTCDVYGAWIDDTVGIAFFINGLSPWAGTILINDDDEVTMTQEVVLSIDISDSRGNRPSTMSFSEDLEHWTAWEPYAATRAFTLTEQDVFPTELKRVYVRVQS